jgi:hypothetical protein
MFRGRLYAGKLYAGRLFGRPKDLSPTVEQVLSYYGALEAARRKRRIFEEDSELLQLVPILMRVINGNS